MQVNSAHPPMAKIAAPKMGGAKKQQAAQAPKHQSKMHQAPKHDSFMKKAAAGKH